MMFLKINIFFSQKELEMYFFWLESKWIHFRQTLSSEHLKPAFQHWEFERSYSYMCVTFCVAERFVYHGTILWSTEEGRHLKLGVQLLVIEYLGYFFFNGSDSI